MLGHCTQTTAILSGHHCVDCKTISCFARSFNDVARKLANDQLLFCALELGEDLLAYICSYTHNTTLELQVTWEEGDVCLRRPHPC